MKTTPIESTTVHIDEELSKKLAIEITEFFNKVKNLNLERIKTKEDDIAFWASCLEALGKAENALRKSVHKVHGATIGGKVRLTNPRKEELN